MLKKANNNPSLANKISVLRTIRDAEEISRKDVVLKTGISSPTVTRIVNWLIKKNLIIEKGYGKSKGGRPPQILCFNEQNSYVIGISWELKFVIGVLAHLDGTVLERIEIKLDLNSSFEQDLCIVERLISKLAKKTGTNYESLKGIGVGVAGYVNKNTSIIEYSVVQKWSGIDLRNPLKLHFGVPVIVESITRVKALGEALFGVANGENESVAVFIDYGLGAGIMIDGIIQKGFDGFSGEIGHLRISPPSDYSNRKCLCGKTNCLAEYSAGRGLVRSAKEFIDNYPESLINNFSNYEKSNIDFHIICKAGKKGDILADKILKDAGLLMGTQLANIANILNPHVVIVGGSLGTQEIYFKYIKQGFEENTLRGIDRKIGIIRSLQGSLLGIKGSVALILEQILNLEI